MDLSKDRVLKENNTFFVADAGGQITGGEHGLYCRDTRHLSRYGWNFGDGVQTLLSLSPRPDIFRAHYGRIVGPSQLVGYSRTLRLESQRLTDTITVENTSLERQEVTLELNLDADFKDMFEARGWANMERGIDSEVENNGVRYAYTAQDGLKIATKVAFSPIPLQLTADRAQFGFTLKPKETVEISVQTEIDTGIEPPRYQGISYEDWRKGFDVGLKRERFGEVLEQAIGDLRALLLFTEPGPMPAAGIPWFVASFGRDSLLTSYMMLPWRLDVAEGTLRYLAASQGKTKSAFHAEASGKIMHELRFGELTRLGKTPFSPYYGTIDATPLFVMLLHELWKKTGKLELVGELRPNWEAALGWIVSEGDLDGDGFIEFASAEPGQALAIQSWKDSHDSMSHADGSLAEGALAVSEVQGYAYAAYRAAAEFYEALGEKDKVGEWRERAEGLQEKFHEAYWQEDLQTYAMALDGEKRPLRVQNSDAGHLLWTGIVLKEVAPKLVKTLMSDELWTGWGIRTLGKNEARYNPVSYHNGSIWPHDTALAAGGMARYGFHEEVARITEALYSLAASQADKRLPELVAGYPRTNEPPIPYPVACRPQAWDAAALLYLLRLSQESGFTF